MSTPNQIERPRYTLIRGILSLLAGWGIGIGLMLLIRSLFNTPIALAIGQGVSFLGFFIGFFWLSEYWRFRRAGGSLHFQSRPFRHHMIAAVVGSVALALLTLLLQ